MPGLGCAVLSAELDGEAGNLLALLWWCRCQCAAGRGGAAPLSEALLQVAPRAGALLYVSHESWLCCST